MKNLLFLLLLIGCSKSEPVEPTLAGRSLWPQNPLPPQVKIEYPLKKWVLFGSYYGWEYPEVKFDTVQMKFSITPGRTWYGTATKLTKYRIAVDNVIVVEQSISNGDKFPMTYIINVPAKSLYNTSLLQDTTFRKWHSVGVTGWQDDNTSASDATYFYKRP